MVAQQVFSTYDHARNRVDNKYKYCPRCGTPLPSEVPDKRRERCSACGWVHYQNPSPGVVVVITDGDQVLLGKRAGGSFAAHKWCLPGGFIEFHEDFLTAAIREVREETGLNVEIRSILSVVSNYLSSELHTLVAVLRADVVSGEPMPGDDIEELRWVLLGVPLPDMAFDADRHIVERYNQTRLEGVPVDPRYARL